MKFNNNFAQSRSEGLLWYILSSYLSVCSLNFIANMNILNRRASCSAHLINCAATSQPLIFNSYRIRLSKSYKAIYLLQRNSIRT